MNVHLLRDIHSGRAADPLVHAQEATIAAQLNTDEYHRASAIEYANQLHKQSLVKVLNQPGVSALHRRRMLKQTIAATKEDRAAMSVEKERRSKLGKHRCETCHKAKRGAARKVWVRADHLRKAEEKLMQRTPSRFGYCDCKERIEEQWHVPSRQSTCHDCQEIKEAGIMPLLNCGHRVYCTICIERHAFCPICTRRYVAPKHVPAHRHHQVQYSSMGESATAKRHQLDDTLRLEKDRVDAEKRQLIEKRKALASGKGMDVQSYRRLKPYPSTVSIERLRRRQNMLHV